MILLDTSAVYALKDSADPAHERACRCLAEIEEGGENLTMTSYSLLESFVLLRRRLGLSEAGDVSRGLARIPTIVVDAALHARGVEWLLEHGSRRVSLVDAVSFVAMEERGIRRAFTFDEDFRRAGFETVP